MSGAGIAAGTDKVVHHAYERFYADFLTGFNGHGSIVEIGYGSGESIGFWKSLYPSAFLYVIDRDLELEGEGFKVLRCDQSRNQQLDELCSLLADKDVGAIIDDGSHIPEHQLETFNRLFCALRPGGVYVIEDIECSYWRYGNCYGYKTQYGLRSARSLMNRLTLLPHWINREFLASRERIGFAQLLRRRGFNLRTLESIGSICFGHNCVAITKGLAGDEKYASRGYRYSEFVELGFRELAKSAIPGFAVPLCKRMLAVMREQRSDA